MIIILILLLSINFVAGDNEVSVFGIQGNRLPIIDIKDSDFDNILKLYEMMLIMFYKSG